MLACLTRQAPFAEIGLGLIAIFSAALRYVFAAAPNCEVIHGTIYTCLRAMFGLSVIGILVSIFSCMLVYQILRSVIQYLCPSMRNRAPMFDKLPLS